jgi:hypothetical protein
VKHELITARNVFVLNRPLTELERVALMNFERFHWRWLELRQVWRALRRAQLRLALFIAFTITLMEAGMLAIVR